MDECVTRTNEQTHGWMNEPLWFQLAGAAYEAVPGELMWQTHGAPHQMHVPSAAPPRQLGAPTGPKRKEGVTRRPKEPAAAPPLPNYTGGAGW